MTRITPTRPVIRQTQALERTDPLVVSLHPRHLTIRLKGKREAFAVPYDAILDLGRRLAWKAKRGT